MSLENFVSTGLSSPDRQVRTYSGFRLRYPSPYVSAIVRNKVTCKITQLKSSHLLHRTHSRSIKVKTINAHEILAVKTEIDLEEGCEDVT
jgi:hypothetical protein